MPLDSNTLAQLGDKMRSKQQQSAGPLNTKELHWIAEGYNLGFLNAEECKARFGRLIDELEQAKGQA